MKKILAIIISIVITLGFIVPASLAWLNDSSFFDVSMDSYVHKSYFESGDGTAATHFGYNEGETQNGKAFEIKYPVQLYYFAWLQYLGYFNQPNENSNSINQVYFWLSEDLDMTGWVLPPIGTSIYPFVGNFDGNGKRITNLTVQNIGTSSSASGDAMSDLPVDSVANAEIIGFFGVIGSLTEGSYVVNGAVEGNNGVFVPKPNYNYSSQINEVKNFTIDGIKIQTETNSALIGAIAGYVNGTVTGTAVADTDLVVDSNTGVLTFTENISDYALVGYCTDAYKFTLNVSKVTLHTPGETHNVIYKNMQGEGAGFGGSIKMQDLFNRLTTIRSSIGGTATTSTYNTAETIIYDEITGETSNPFDVTTATVAFRQRTYDSTAGSYSFSRYSNTAEGGNGTNIVYLMGNNSRYTKTQTKITKKNQSEDGYLISQGANYLNINNSLNGLTTGTNQDTATGWVFDNSNHIYTYGEDGRKYYINASTNITVDTTGSTVWTWSNDHLYFNYNNMNYYLIYNNGWTIIPEYYYLISDGQGNYLRYNNGFSNTTDANLASQWTFSNNGTNPSGYISTNVDNTTYYIRYNNGLDVTTSTTNRTSWSNNGTRLYSGTNYIKFDGVNWSAGALETYYTIHNGGNYLNVTAINGVTATIGTGSSITYNSNNGNTLWKFSTTGTNPSGTISTVVNGTTYYLYDNNGTLSCTTTNNTNWSNNGTSIYNLTDYLGYDNGWKIETVSTMAIKSGSYYLNITAANTTPATLGTGNSIATGSVSNHTYWTISNGQIYAVANGRTYYLRNNNGTLEATTTTYNGWEISDNTIISDDYYLSYQTYVSKWVLLPYPSYTINRGGTYLNLTGTSATSYGSGTSVADWTDSSGHTIWKFSTTGTHPSGTICTMYNGTLYYLYSNNNNTLNISTTNSTNWTNSNNTNNRLYYSTEGWYGNTYYLYYRNNTWGVGTSTGNSRANMTLTSISAPTINFENNSCPSVTLTSQTQVAISSTIKTFTTLNNLSRISKQVQVITREVNTVSAEYPADTYIPLNVNGGTWNANNDSIEASDSNTGYIVSGANFENTDYPNRSGDIRVSEYNMSSISSSVNYTSNFTYSSTYDSRLEIITAVNYNTYNGFYRVSDSFNQSNNNISNSISSAVENSRKITFSNLGLKRYEDARASLSETFLNKNKIYGLHFMNADIDMNDCAIVPQAIVNGEEISNLPVPRNSIDFFVKRRGFITVFAGTYFTDNDAFFSLHEISRYTEEDTEVKNGSKKVNDIRWIKEISKIYKASTGSDFIYEYSSSSGGGYSSSASRGDLVFDMSWMTNPSVFVNNAVYYFEIPVNGGEYALGSVTGKQGAYLFYLDIAANAGTAEDKERVTVTEKFIDETYSVELPKGVQLVENNEGTVKTYDNNNPYALPTIELKSGYSGTYPLDRTGNNFTYTLDNNANLTYYGEPLNPQTSSGGGQSYTYYPFGYKIRYLEHVTDLGKDTSNYDHLLIETIDDYDSSGTRTGRTVKVYADIENLEVSETVNESSLDLIVSFTYNPTGHDNMKTRVVRASSDGGYNITFDETINLISVTIDSADVHVNFGDNTASTLITASAATPLSSNKIVPAVNMSGTSDVENTYYGSVYGEALATYTMYYEGEDVEVTPTTQITMPQLSPGNANQSRNLTYAITLTPGTGVTEVTVFGKLLATSTTYTTKVFGDNNKNSIVNSGTITVTPTVTINGTTLKTASQEISINGN